MTIVVDSDWIIDALAARPAALQTLIDLRGEGLAVSAVTLGEVFEGAYDRPDPAVALASYRQFLIGYAVLPVTADVAGVFARIRAELRQQGQRLSDLDLLIAATALHHSLELLTRNRKHFERVPGLRLYEPT